MRALANPISISATTLVEKQNMHTRTQQLNDSKERQADFGPKNTGKNASKSQENALFNPVLAPISSAAAPSSPGRSVAACTPPSTATPSSRGNKAAHTADPAPTQGPHPCGTLSTAVSRAALLSPRPGGAKSSNRS